MHYFKGVAEVRCFSLDDRHNINIGLHCESLVFSTQVTGSERSLINDDSQRPQKNEQCSPAGQGYKNIFLMFGLHQFIVRQMTLKWWKFNKPSKIHFKCMANNITGSTKETQGNGNVQESTIRKTINKYGRIAIRKPVHTHKKQTLLPI